MNDNNVTAIVKLTHAARDVGQPETWVLEWPEYTDHGIEGIEAEDGCRVLIPWSSVAYVLR